MLSRRYDHWICASGRLATGQLCHTQYCRCTSGQAGTCGGNPACCCDVHNKRLVASCLASKPKTWAAAVWRFAKSAAHRVLRPDTACCASCTSAASQHHHLLARRRRCCCLCPCPAAVRHSWPAALLHPLSPGPVCDAPPPCAHRAGRQQQMPKGQRPTAQWKICAGTVEAAQRTCHQFVSLANTNTPNPLLVPICPPPLFQFSP